MSLVRHAGKCRLYITDTYHFEVACDWEARLNVSSVDVTSTASGGFSEYLRREDIAFRLANVTYTPPENVYPPADANMVALAVAVLRGDRDAAGLLAAEVMAEWQQRGWKEASQEQTS